MFIKNLYLILLLFSKTVIIKCCCLSCCQDGDKQTSSKKSSTITNHKIIFDFKTKNKYLPNEYNIYYNILINKYLKNKLPDSIYAEPIESLGKCFKITINGNDVVYVQKEAGFKAFLRLKPALFFYSSIV